MSFERPNISRIQGYTPGALVRHFAQPRLDNRLRITVGSETDNAVLIEKLWDIPR